MKHLKKINEMAGKSIFINKRVIDVQYNIDKDAYKLIMEYAKSRVRGNKSYFSYYVPSECKHISEVKDTNNIIIDPNDPNDEYVYERGDDPITDYLLDNGVHFGEEIIFLIWW